MALNLKNAEVERLAEEVAKLAGESKTEAVRKALLERKARLAVPVEATRARQRRAFLEREVWPLIPDRLRGKHLTRKEEDAILGLGPDGV
ncbi:protein transcription factor [bacterium]|nr:MAG: protein transcription factor [bacterium]